MIRLVVSYILLGSGCITALLAIGGVFQFRFVMNRMHSAAIVDSIGFFLIIAGLVVYSWSMSFFPKLLLVVLFQWLGSPIASHMVARLELETDEEAGEHMKKEDL